ncbi:HAD-IA family hydrolase [Chengkuizengella axinellae]|uniref:HAD-IA family hydrolase n=1 Tax=Chengkuizengella axinellae TaxID=3064388 RepID=A0ABT9J4J0_9BACL|nr:HAD-IA family hydrolase [Chengkuizengella sp. 2205SS18-9]MDP5276550.1 HAD-IA family hydrolase [Chengkuizengella sp. 2205SS18-9]
MKAIVFDFDGTILDTETPWYDVYLETYKDYGVDLPIEVWSQVIGTDGIHILYDYLQENATKEVNLQEVREITSKKHKQVMEKKELRPGVKAYFDEAKERGLRLAIASSSNREWVEYFLEKCNIRQYFEIIKTSDDVEKVKPDPALYLEAIKELEISADEAIAIEDSPKGAQAAKAAGLHCVTIPNDITKLLPFEEVDVQITSMAEVSLASVISQINK